MSTGRLIYGPDFGTKSYFPRPVEEDVVRRGLAALSGRKPGRHPNFFVILGCSGIGKTSLLSHVIRDPKNVDVLSNFDIVIWLNCAQWHDGFAPSGDDDGADEKRQKFLDELLRLGWLAQPVDKGYKSLKQMMEHFANASPNKARRILFVLDDVCHYSILDTFRNECPSAFCCLITPNSAILKDANVPDKEIVALHTVRCMTEEKSFETFKKSYKLKGKLDKDQIADLVKRSGGVPLLVSLMAGNFIGNVVNNFGEVFDKLISCVEGGPHVQKTANQLFDVAWLSFTPHERYLFYTFLFVDPMEEVEEGWLCTFWNCWDEVPQICSHWGSMALLTSVRYEYGYYYRVHQFVHQRALEMAASEFNLDMSSEYFLSNLRIRLLIQEGQQPTATNLLKGLSLRSGCASLVLRHIEDEAFAFLDRSGKLSDVKPEEYERVYNEAVDQGHYHLAKFFLEKIGVLIDQGYDFGITSAMTASKNGHAQLVDLLISKGCQIEAKEFYGRTALYQAAEEGHLEVVKGLLYRGAQVDACDNRGVTPLMAAASQGHEKIVGILLSAGADIHFKDKKGSSVMMHAVNSWNLRVVEMLILAGCQVTEPNADGVTAIMNAAKCANERAVRLLLLNGASVAEADNCGQTALMKAACAGDDKSAEQQAAEKAEIEQITKLLNGQEVDGDAALTAGGEAARTSESSISPKFTVCGSYARVIELLLANGARVDAEDHDCETALWKAATRGFVNIAELLIINGANTNVRNREGRKLLSTVRHLRHKEIAKLLLSNGAK